ncbi:MAG: lipoyl(octanoyl) transferase LipB [Gemmataceae bacterium]
MSFASTQQLEMISAGANALSVYLLGEVDFDEAWRWQQRLVYETAGNRQQATLMLCEHPPLITVGRQGSRRHILAEPEELRARQWRVRWVNRGGGCVLHLPGQLAIYPILPLDRLGLGLQDYVNRLQDVCRAVLLDFGVLARRDPDGPDALWVADRPIAGFGAAVRDWVSYFGAYLNICPDLPPYRLVKWGGAEVAPMTSLVRERRGPLRSALVRQRLLEHFQAQFGFERISLFFHHPALSRKAPTDAFAASP